MSLSRFSATEGGRVTVRSEYSSAILLNVPYRLPRILLPGMIKAAPFNRVAHISANAESKLK